MMQTRHLTGQHTMHGVFIEVNSLGALITGSSNIGKSEVALELIERGHRLIADDSVLISKNPEAELVGKCPATLQDFLEVRGLGILNIRAMFGDNSICTVKSLHLIIHLFKASPEQLHSYDRFNGLHDYKTILDVPVPQISIPVTPGRNIALLVESAVRNQLLKNNGYDASSDFINRQHTFIASDRKRHGS